MAAGRQRQRGPRDVRRSHRREDLVLDDGVDRLEGRRCHADDREGHTVDDDVASNGAGVPCQAPPPEGIAHDGNRPRGCRAVLIGGEEPPHLRSHAEHLEVVPRHQRAECNARFGAGNGNAERAVVERG
jgi:hypothetical protein